MSQVSPSSKLEYTECKVFRPQVSVLCVLCTVTLCSPSNKDMDINKLLVSSCSTSSSSPKRQKTDDTVVSVQSSLPEAPKTMDDLIDDCLIPVLARVPFDDQFTRAPLTCQRFSTLLKQVHLKRTRLTIWNEDGLPVNSYSPNTRKAFHSTLPNTPDRYARYLALLFQQESHGYEMYMPDPDYWLERSLKRSASVKICDRFPNLKHLSLLGVSVKPNTLHRLLKHFQLNLEALFLRPEWNFRSIRSERKQISSIRSIVSLIDGMSCLRKLALHEIPHLSDLSTVLSNVLPNLEELQLSYYDSDVYPVLLCLDDSKLKRLDLFGIEWPDMVMLTRLVAAKPALRENLTHLALSDIDNTHHVPFAKSGALDLLIIQQIGTLFDGLEYLEIKVDVPLSDILPRICNLKNLAHLSFFGSSRHGLDGLHLNWSPTEISKYGLPSLQILVLESFFIDPEHLFILSRLFSNLCQLYLDMANFKCPCLPKKDSYSDRFDLPSRLPDRCNCKSRIIEAISGFEKMPKIQAAP